MPGCRRPTIRARLSALFAVVALAAAACGGGGDGREAADGGDGPAAEPTTSTAEAPASTTTSAAASGECGLEGGYPAPWPERPRYAVTLDVDPEVGAVTGEMEVEFQAEAATDRLVFRLWANGPRAGRAGGRMEIVETLLDGEPARTSYEDGGAAPGTPGTIFEVHGSFTPGTSALVHLRFRLDMPGSVNERIARVGTTLRLGSALPTLAWLRGEGWHTSPAVDAFSESVATEVADWDVRVRVPDGFTVLATGREVEPGRFVSSAVRDWAATVGRLRLAEQTALDGRTRVVVGVDETSGDDEHARLAVVVDALEAMSDRYGPYPSPVLTVGITPGLGGGIEFPEHLQLGTDVGNSSLVHEVAHMWFYSLVGNDQYADPWLDEGLTEYAEHRHLGAIGALRSRSVPVGGAGNLGEGHDYWAARTGIFYRSVYVQGAQALVELSDSIGGLEGLDCALRRYVLEHAHSVADSADFVESFEVQTGVDPRPVLRRYGVEV